MSELDDLFGEVIHRYTRAQAIEDGELVEVSKSDEAIETGIKYPVALTRAVWDRYVEVPEGVWGQDPKGRLWDILWLFSRCAKRSSPFPTDRFFFRVHVRNDNREGTPPTVLLEAVCGPGDEGEPVITVQLPDED